MLLSIRNNIWPWRSKKTTPIHPYPLFFFSGKLSFYLKNIFLWVLICWLWKRRVNISYTFILNYSKFIHDRIGNALNKGTRIRKSTWYLESSPPKVPHTNEHLFNCWINLPELITMSNTWLSIQCVNRVENQDGDNDFGHVSCLSIRLDTPIGCSLWAYMVINRSNLNINLLCCFDYSFVFFYFIRIIDS